MKRADAKHSGAGEQSLLSIGDVAAATGISTETLRMWERRYGRPEAVRLPSGHRRYTQAHVRWLRRVAEALAHGHRPHKVVRLADDELGALLGPADAGESRDEVLAGHIRAAQAFDVRALSAALERELDGADVVAWLEKSVAPLLRAVGRRWADGDLEIRHEHFASEIVSDVLRTQRCRLPAPTGEARVVLATLPGETHGMGLQMAALICAAEGVPARLLGVNTPVDEIAEAASRLGVAMVGISVTLATGGVVTDRALAALRKALPQDVRLVVGGEGARGVRRGPRGVEYAAGLGDWAVFVASLDPAA